MKGDWDAELAAAWTRFVDEYRRTRAPAELRERVLAALAAERAALGRETQERGARGHDRPGADATT